MYTQLRVLIYKTHSPYQPESRTILYDSMVPTDANVGIGHHSANVNGGPDATSDGFVPICLQLRTLEANRGIGSANVKRALLP